MSFIPADSASVSLFVILSLGMAFLVFIGIRQTSVWKKWLALLFILVLAITGASTSGAIVRSFFPLAPVLMISLFVFGITFSLSISGKELAQALPFSILIGFQSFRVPLELILHHWAKLGTIPETMTWTGQNWDIVSGILCGATFYFVNKNKRVALIVNFLGFTLLLNVLRVVILSSPLPFSWQLERPLLLIAYFPYSLIGPLFVLPAFIGHIVTFRKLALKY